MDGLLLVDKPAGWTSHDVVAKVRGILKSSQNAPRIRVGHTGTLDPLATGLLVLAIGAYTKRASQWVKLDKVYEGEITLGATSTTDDGEGEITSLQNPTIPDEQTVRTALLEFEGSQQQIPPQFSAVKIAGQRAYKQARQGREVELKSRPVTIYEIAMTAYDWPRLRFTANVSSGTYIRSLARDFGKTLKVGGYLSALRRTRVGLFLVSDAAMVENLSKKTIQDHLQQA